MTDKLIRLSDALALFKLPYQLLAKFEVEALPAVAVVPIADVLKVKMELRQAQDRLAALDDLARLGQEYDAAPDLTDPVTVHANMLRGTIAKPTVEQIIHLYGVDALTKALAPVIVREAGIEPVAAPDPAAIREAALREAAKTARKTVECCQSCASVEIAILALIPKGTADDRA